MKQYELRQTIWQAIQDGGVTAVTAVFYGQYSYFSQETSVCEAEPRQLFFKFPKSAIIVCHTRLDFTLTAIFVLAFL